MMPTPLDPSRTIESYLNPLTMDLNTLTNSLSNAFDTHLSGIIASLPSLIGGVVVLLLGWLLAKFLRSLTGRLMKRMQVDAMAQRTGLDVVLGKLGGLELSGLIRGLVYAIVLLVFLLAAADVAGIGMITSAIERFFTYLPILLTALAILVMGLWVAEKARNGSAMMMASLGIGGGKVLSRVAFGLIALFAGITALNVAGIDTTLITSNILIILGAVCIAFAFAYGLASRDILTNILSSYYGKDRLQPGMRVRIGEDEGVIERIDAISITLGTRDRAVLLPCSMLVTHRIEVLDDPTNTRSDTTEQAE